MYIVNPFHKEGLKASDLSSTHPRISERIRILRSMAGNSLGDYDRAYRQVHRGGKGIMSDAATIQAGMAPLAETRAGTKAKEPDEMQRARETSDVMWRLNKYKTINCDCGVKLRVPPGYKDNKITCPHCGRIHPL